MTEIKLISVEFGRDEYHQEIEIETERTVLANEKSVTRSEFYAAATTGFQPEIVFDVHAFEYQGERIVGHGGRRYSVLRTYDHVFDGIQFTELTCGGRVGS